MRQRSVWGERFLRWDNIESFATNGFNYTVKDGKRAIRYGAFIADATGLRDEIERRSGVKIRNQSQNQLD